AQVTECVHQMVVRVLWLFAERPIAVLLPSVQTELANRVPALRRDVEPRPACDVAAMFRGADEEQISDACDAAKDLIVGLADVQSRASQVVNTIGARRVGPELAEAPLLRALIPNVVRDLALVPLVETEPRGAAAVAVGDGGPEPAWTPPAVVPA